MVCASPQGKLHISVEVLTEEEGILELLSEERRQYVSVWALRIAALTGGVVPINLPLGSFLMKGDLLRASGGSVSNQNIFIT